MAKKQLTKEEKKEKLLLKLQKFYEEADAELHISGKSINEQVHQLVNKCLELQSQICTASDEIKIDDFELAKGITEGIDKKTYLDFVKICVAKNNDKLKEKAIQKFESDFGNRLVIANLRHSFLESYMSGNDLKITDEDNYEYKAFSDYKSEDFESVMEQSAKKREYINSVLYKEYRKYANAAQFITKLDLTYSDFKNLVDWEYYKEGGYPSPKTPAKLWSIFNRFNKAIRLMNKYEFTQQNELNHEFGLSVQCGEEHPVDHPWMLGDDDE